MTILKNSDRDEVLRLVLSKSFEPRFAKIQTKLAAILKRHLSEHHAVFLRLMKDVECLEYLAIGKLREFRFEDRFRFVTPRHYGSSVSIPEHGYVDRAEYSIISDFDIALPAAMDGLHINDAEIIAEYLQIWADYTKSRGKLLLLLRAYKTREKFEADFPEFAKYLPKIIISIKPPAIIVADVRKSLRKLGIPEKC